MQGIAQNDNLGERLVVHFENVLFEEGLIVFLTSGLLTLLTVDDDLKEVWFDASANNVFVRPDRELNLNDAIPFVDGVDDLILLDLSERLLEQHVAESVEHRRFTAAVSAQNERRRRGIETNSCW